MNKKFIAPLVIVILASIGAIGYAGVYLFILSRMNLPIIFNILILVIAIAVVGALITVFVQRIKEIKTEDENDLSKY